VPGAVARPIAGLMYVIQLGHGAQRVFLKDGAIWRRRKNARLENDGTNSRAEKTTRPCEKPCPDGV